MLSTYIRRAHPVHEGVQVQTMLLEPVSFLSDITEPQAVIYGMHRPPFDLSVGIVRRIRFYMVIYGGRDLHLLFGICNMVDSFAP